MLFLFVGLLLAISVIDHRYHRIPNLLLLLLLPVALLIFHPRLDLAGIAIAATVLLSANKFFGLGMGDVKLLLILLSIVIKPSELSRFLFLGSLAICIYLALTATVRREFPKRIALAPPLVCALFCMPKILVGL